MILDRDGKFHEARVIAERQLSGNSGYNPEAIIELSKAFIDLLDNGFPGYMKKSDCITKLDNSRAEFVGDGPESYERRITDAINSLK